MVKINKSTNVATAGFLFARSNVEAVDALTKAHAEGQDLKAMWTDFIGGYIAATLWPTENLAKAIAKGKGIVGAAGAGRKPKAGQATRTDEQEAAFTAGRQAWSRIARKAGLVADKRGGARTVKKGKGKGKAEKATKGKATVGMPKVKDQATAHMHLMNMAKMASGFVAKNHDHVSAEASGAVADFLAAMSKLAK